LRSPESHKLLREALKALRLPIGRPILDAEVPTLDVPEFPQAAAQCVEVPGILTLGYHRKHADSPDLRR
jgi:hypothetical protein